MPNPQDKLIRLIEEKSKKDFNSRRSFAKSVPCSEGTLRSLFSGKTYLTLDLLIKLAGALNESPSSLMKQADL